MSRVDQSYRLNLHLFPYANKRQSNGWVPIVGWIKRIRIGSKGNRLRTPQESQSHLHQGNYGGGSISCMFVHAVECTISLDKSTVHRVVRTLHAKLVRIKAHLELS